MGPMASTCIEVPCYYYYYYYYYYYSYTPDIYTVYRGVLCDYYYYYEQSTRSTGSLVPSKQHILLTPT